MKWTFAAGKAELSVKGNDFHTRNVTVNFVYRFGGYKDRERKKVDTSRFGH